VRGSLAVLFIKHIIFNTNYCAQCSLSFPWFWRSIYVHRPIAAHALSAPLILHLSRRMVLWAWVVRCCVLRSKLRIRRIIWFSLNIQVSAHCKYIILKMSYAYLFKYIIIGDTGENVIDTWWQLGHVEWRVGCLFNDVCQLKWWVISVCGVWEQRTF
jgi:hypothetical protein